MGSLKNPRICIKHFEEKCIVRVDKVQVKNEIKEFDRINPKLQEDAIPTIFEGLPSYLSKKSTSVKRLANVEENNLELAIKASLESLKDYKSSQQINNVSDILKFYESNSCINKHWILYQEDDNVFLCYLIISDNIPTIEASMCIQQDFSVILSVKKENIPQTKIPKKLWLVRTVRTLEELLKFLEDKLKSYAYDELDVIDACINKLCSIENECEDTSILEEGKCNYLTFIIEQLKLYKVKPNFRRYSGETMLIAVSLFIQSSAAYFCLYKSNTIFLPHPRNIKKIICKISLTDTDLSGSIKYLKTKLELLKSYEFLVNVHIDEVYINAQIQFKGGRIFGRSENSENSSKIAKTAQVFMISSLLSKYRDVVCIIPVCNMTANQLKKYLLDVIVQVESIGFKIISVISDNGAINRKAFQLLSIDSTLQPYITHPADSERLLFLIFDTVHLLKCIRNCWISIKKNGSLLYPDFDTNYKGEALVVQLFEASFKYLVQLYENEKSSLIKFGNLLSYKALYPSTIQKQNVKLALKIFDERNIAALKQLGKKFGIEEAM